MGDPPSLSEFYAPCWRLGEWQHDFFESPMMRAIELISPPGEFAGAPSRSLFGREMNPDGPRGVWAQNHVLYERAWKAPVLIK